MSVDWLNFKSILDDSNTSASYIDDEGTEIPIESKYEFQEAIRFAKVNKGRFKLILYGKKSEGREEVMQNHSECMNAMPCYLFCEAPKEEKMLQDSFSKESSRNKCQCNENDPPEWFIQYMEKFKKELLLDLKSNFYDIFHSTVDKEIKLKLKGDINDSLNKKVEVAVMSVCKKKKKGSEKDVGDLLDQREVKLAKKIEKVHPLKFDRLEKLENKTRMLEDKRRLLERKRHSKTSKVTTINGNISGKEPLRKSVSFHKNEACVVSLPNAEFVVTLNFTNNGLLRWEAPWLECFDFNGLCPEEKQISLPRLLPMESGCTTLKGRVCENKGFLHFKCRLYDGLENFGPEFTCWAWVDGEESLNKLQSCSADNSKGFGEMKKEDSVDLLMNEKHEFTAVRKKIEKNISDIERNLQDIDLLQPSAAPEDTLKTNKENYKMTVELQSRGCDSQNFEKREMNWKEKLEQENLNFGFNCSHAAFCIRNKQDKPKDEKTKAEKLDISCEAENDSDSELSVVFISEDDDNFSVVQLPSGCSSPTESFDEDKFSATCRSKRYTNRSNASRKKAESVEIKSIGSPPVSVKVNEKVLNSRINRQLQPEFIKPENSSVEVEFLVSKAKKIKSGSTEFDSWCENMTPTYIVENLNGKSLRFTSKGEKEEKTNLTDCVFEEDFSKNITSEKIKEKKSIPESVFSRKPWEENSTDTEKEKSSSSQNMREGQQSKSVYTENKEEKPQEKVAFNSNKIATTDALGRTIYAVHSSGCCFPTADLLKDKDHLSTSNPNGSLNEKELKNSHANPRQCDRFNEVPSVVEVFRKIIIGI